MYLLKNDDDRESKQLSLSWEACSFYTLTPETEYRNISHRSTTHNMSCTHAHTEIFVMHTETTAHMFLPKFSQPFCHKTGGADYLWN